MNKEQYHEELVTINGTPVRITSYKAGNEFHCKVSPAEPGAAIATASGSSKEAAVNDALNKASQRILIKGKSL